MQLLNGEQMKKLNVIQADHPGDSEKCCTALFNYWLQVDTAASWDKLIIALNHIGQDALASTIKRKTTRSACTYTILTCIRITFPGYSLFVSFSGTHFNCIPVISFVWCHKG